MSRQNLFAVILAICLVNGLLSPFVAVIFMIAPIWMISLFPGVQELAIIKEFVFYISSLIVSTATLLISGVPAALVERLIPESEGSAGVMWIWLAGAVFLALPAFQKLLNVL